MSCTTRRAVLLQVSQRDTDHSLWGPLAGSSGFRSSWQEQESAEWPPVYTPHPLAPALGTGPALWLGVRPGSQRSPRPPSPSTHPASAQSLSGAAYLVSFGASHCSASLTGLSPCLQLCSTTLRLVLGATVAPAFLVN